MRAFSEFVDLYAEKLRGLHRNPSTLRNYTIAVRSFANYCQVEEHLVDIRLLEPRHFSNYLRYLKNQPLSPLTAYGWQRQVRTWLAWLTLQGHLLIDPSKNHDWRCPKLLPRGSPTEAQVLQLLQAPPADTLPGQRDRAIFEFLYGTGLRMSECCLMDVEHVCLTRLEIQVRNGKGNRQRVVPIGPRLAQILTNYLQTVRPQLEKQAQPALWLNRFGNRMRPLAVEDRFRLYSKDSGVGSITAHTLRHAYATHLLAHGAPIVAIQRLLGHVTLSMTSRYISLVPIDVQDSILTNHPRGQQRARKGSSKKPS